MRWTARYVGSRYWHAHARLLALAGTWGIMNFVKLPRTEARAAEFLKYAAAYFDERSAQLIRAGMRRGESALAVPRGE
jgi:hypothetical protein